MEQWQIEVAERLARIEANQEFLKSSVANLPQSEKCAEDIKDLKKKITTLEDFKTAVNTKIAYIGGVLVMIGVFVPYAIKWVFDHISFKGL